MSWIMCSPHETCHGQGVEVPAPSHSDKRGDFPRAVLGSSRPRPPLQGTGVNAKMVIHDLDYWGYPLVNIQKAIENGPLKYLI